MGYLIGDPSGRSSYPVTDVIPSIAKLLVIMSLFKMKGSDVSPCGRFDPRRQKPSDSSMIYDNQSWQSR